MMDHVMVCPVNTVSHVPHSVCARVLRIKVRKACSSVWGFVHLTMFAKAVLCTPSTSYSLRHRFVMSSILPDHLYLCQCMYS